MFPSFAGSLNYSTYALGVAMDPALCVPSLLLEVLSKMLKDQRDTIHFKMV